MSKKDEALKLALEALEPMENGRDDTVVQRAITAIKEAQAEQPAQHKTTGWLAPKDNYSVLVLFNPYSGEPRDVRDVQSDPQGILIAPPGKVEMLAARPTVKECLSLEQPAQQEPVAQVNKDPDTGKPFVQWTMPLSLFADGTKFYTSPPQSKPWVGLTDEEIKKIWGSYFSRGIEFARAIEAKLNEKNA